ncbi:acylamino-acid-releasing enzyme-like [Xenia sp. Carnegie-2017]|uniref:acylamino-acid-releasing enzyme-like n=1 Tax=Xenia sp. Carnegie-2017 TaxID=2897299 RepID=UPI001F038C3A|nr:acylamino-acid-releasing enzyme-like [Xenia sp. Carnegie-2017]
MADILEWEDKAVQLYEKFAAIPSVSKARLSVEEDQLKLESEWSQRNLILKEKRLFLKTFYFKLNVNSQVDGKYLEVPPTQLNNKQISCSTKTGNLTAIVRKIAGDAKKNDTQHIEIWSRTHCIKCYTLENVLSKHGTIHNNDEISCLEWSPCQRYLLYIADKLSPKTESYFAEKKEKSEIEDEKLEKGNKFAYRQNFGEQMNTIHETVLVILDTKNDEVKVIEGLPDNICPGPALWGRDSCSVIFCGWAIQPHILGVKYCRNRKTGIYLLSLDDNSCVVLSNEDEACSSPRLSPCGEKLVYLSGIPYGPHMCCQKMIMLEMKKLEGKRILVDVVDKPNNAEAFPGIYNFALPKRTWSEDSRYVIFHSIWRSNQVIIAIDVLNGMVSRITSGNGCWTVLDIVNGFILASFSTPNSPQVLMLAKLPSILKDAVLSWIRVGDDFGSLEDVIEWNIVSFTPKDFQDYWQQYEGYLMKPIVDDSRKIPLIVFPHGGPHSASLTCFNLYGALFCKLGFAVLFVNYRGSLGFGQSALTSLPGKISIQDVEDVQNAVMTVLKNHHGVYDETKIFVTGGSHGGFLSAHLIGQNPNFYRSCAMRNPVIDLTVMMGTSDIPDWCYCEGGDKFSFDDIPSLQLRTKLLQVSPIVHAHKVKTPTLLLLGGSDLRVPSSQGLLYYKTLKAHGIKTRCLFYPEDNHSLDKVETEADVFINMIKWFASSLPIDN